MKGRRWEARTTKRLAVALYHVRANFSEIKSVINGIISNLGLTPVGIEPTDLPCFIDGRKLVAKVDGMPICWAVELRPKALESWVIEMPMADLEIDVDDLIELTRRGENSSRSGINYLYPLAITYSARLFNKDLS